MSDMQAQINSVIVDADTGNRQELATFLGQFGIQPIVQLAGAEGLAAALARGEGPQLAIINLDPDTHENLKRIARLPREHPQVSFFVMSHVLDANLLMEAMHLGIKEFIPLPIAEDKFAAAIERVTHAQGMGSRAKIVHVIPTIGGCGSTTLACNLAALLAQRTRTALLDLDLIGGGVASYFDVRPRYTISDVMESAEKVDKQLLDNALVIHSRSQLAILARPDQPEDALRVNQAGFQRLSNVLRRMFDFVVIDSAMSIDPLYADAIRSADVNLIVMQLNVPSAKNAERFVGALRRMGIDAARIRIVVNRYVRKGCDIEPDEVERSLGLKIAWMVPNDFRNAIAAINYGEPVVLRAPRSEISTSLQGLAQELSQRPVAHAHAA